MPRIAARPLNRRTSGSGNRTDNTFKRLLAGMLTFYAVRAVAVQPVVRDAKPGTARCENIALAWAIFLHLCPSVFQTDKVPILVARVLQVVLMLESVSKQTALF